MSQSQYSLSHIFEEKAACSQSDTTPLLPVSFRVTSNEKARLKKLAGKKSISAYVRHALLGDEVTKTRRGKSQANKPYEPKVDTVEIARLLGMFGQSELATSMLALSLAAQQGELEMSDEVEDKIESACDDIATIKVALIMALGVKPQSI